jgi:hypothetical protein
MVSRFIEKREGYYQLALDLGSCLVPPHSRSLNRLRLFAAHCVDKKKTTALTCSSAVVIINLPTALLLFR